MQDSVEPQLADPLMAGKAPFRASVYCQPFREANGHGWHVAPPMDVWVKWDGDAFYWRITGDSGWRPLDYLTVRTYRRLAQHPEINIGEEDQILSMPLLRAAREPGILQIWTGFIVETSPSWNLLVRGIPNNTCTAYEAYEGVIETSWWHGPVIGNLRFRKTDHPVKLSRQEAIFALQLVAEASYRRELQHYEYYEPNRGSFDLLQEALEVRDPALPGGYKREVMRKRKSN